MTINQIFIVKKPDCTDINNENILFDAQSAFLFTLDNLTIPPSLTLSNETIPFGDSVEFQTDCLGNPVHMLLQYLTNVYVFYQLTNGSWIYSKAIKVQESNQETLELDNMDTFLVIFIGLFFIVMHLIFWYRWVYILSSSTD